MGTGHKSDTFKSYAINYILLPYEIDRFGRSQPSLSSIDIPPILASLSMLVHFLKIEIKATYKGFEKLSLKLLP